MADEKGTEQKRGWEWFSFERVKWIVLLIILSLLVIVIWQNGLKDIFTQDGTGNLLTKLSQVDFGRFLITSFVVLIVAIVAANMAFALFNRKVDPETSLEKRFMLGKELLTVFIGLLGTLMGFYFAENRVSPDSAQKIANIAQNPITSSTGTSLLETKAFDLLIKQDFDGAVKAFDDVSRATPPSSNIANISAITTYLMDSIKKAALTATGDKKEAWKDLYCFVYKGGMAIGQSKEIIDKFASGCNPPPTPSPTQAANTNTSSTPLPAATTSNAVNSTANTTANTRVR